jgi:uncharacterized protein YggU (UPF0235/DUF167 family)
MQPEDEQGKADEKLINMFDPNFSVKKKRQSKRKRGQRKRKKIVSRRKRTV